MELDDLKQTWKQTDNIPTSQNNNIMELIHQKSNGPIALLKQAFKNQVRFIVIIALLILVTNFRSVDQPSKGIILLGYMAFCAVFAIFFYYNYRLVSKMEVMDGVLKANLEKQIDILETRLKWHINGIAVVLIFFIVLAEVLPYFQHLRMLDKWHAVSPIIRFAAYAILITYQYFRSRKSSNRKFGQHLTYLKELVKELQ